MKRTITLTAENLAPLTKLDPSSIMMIVAALKDRLDGSEIVMAEHLHEHFKKLDALTVPVKTVPLWTPEVCQLCADRMNGLLGTKFRPNAQSMKSHVSARLREGYKQEDFLAVIDKKVAEWKGTDMEKYLRPETLFGPKFEGYLNQSVSTGAIQTAASQAHIDYAEGL